MDRLFIFQQSAISGTALPRQNAGKRAKGARIWLESSCFLMYNPCIAAKAPHQERRTVTGKVREGMHGLKQHHTGNLDSDEPICGAGDIARLVRLAAAMPSDANERQALEVIAGATGRSAAEVDRCEIPEPVLSAFGLRGRKRLSMQDMAKILHPRLRTSGEPPVGWLT